MIKKLLAISITLAFSTASNLTLAEGNISSGERKSESCAGCHGSDGNSLVATFPKLAGQHSGYITQQLHAFKDGIRNAPMMVPLAMALDKDDMEDIAAYYASKRLSANQLPIIDDDDEDSNTADKDAEIKALVATGADLYRNGNLVSEVSACVACHGPAGEGNRPASFPSLRRQHADYLIKALTDFKQGARSNTPDNMMHMIAKKMSDKEIQAVSYYISMLK